MTFLRTGVRLSELAALTLEDVDFENRLLAVRQGKGRKDRQIPLVEEEVKGLRNYLRYRATELILDDDTLFLAKTARPSTSHRSRRLSPSTSKRPGSANG